MLNSRHYALNAALSTLLASVLAAALSSSASAAPRVIAGDFDGPTVTGKEVNLRIHAVDPRAPVSGMLVTFGSASELFGLSACRPPGSDGRAPGGPFAPGSPVTLQAPHQFSRTGPQPVVARVDSGGCGAPGGSVSQPLEVTPTQPGVRPVPPTTGLPALLPGLVEDLERLLGGLDIPGLPILGSTADRRGAASAAANPLALASARCPGAHRRVRNTRSGLRRARRGLLCAVNVVRRRNGRRSLRQNSRLLRAAAGHSRSMVRRGYFSHTAPGRVGFVTRLRRVRYLPARRWLVGENLAAGGGSQGTPLSILRAWLRSPPHRSNLLDGSFREVGLGIVAGRPRSGRRGATYTADFGFRR